MGIIGIIGALASEVELLVQQMEEGSVLRHAGLEFHYGLPAGKPAVVVRCGIGKVDVYKRQPSRSAAIFRLVW